MLNRIPFLQICLAYISGILIACLLPGINTRYLLIVLTLSVPILLLFKIKNSGYFKNSIALIFFLILTGIYRYSNYNPEFIQETGEKYIATILEYPVEKTNSLKTEALLEYIEGNADIFKTKEKLILYFETDSVLKNLKPGSRIIFTMPPNLIRNRGNPDEFDYKKYLANKKTYRQVYLRSGTWYLLDTKPAISLRIFAEKIRYKLLKIYHDNHITDESFAILSALTLGYKDALDPETKEIYASCGAMHVLAVSGLHVGIIYLAVNLMIGFLKKLKAGRYLFIITAIIILWFYALLTGLSPSVLRASLMFSVLIIGENLRRPTNIYNTLAVSAFILLFFNPNLLFETGFQLSYSAVTGIVFFQPKIYKMMNFSNIFLDYAWALFSVSIAAQISTFPLTIYYFHQFPVYFWLSNFIVIPGAFSLIFLSIAVIITSPFPSVSMLFSNEISFILDTIYFLLKWIKELPFSVIQYIHIGKFQFILLYLIIGFLVLFITRTKIKYLFLMLTSIICVFTINISHKYQCTRQNKIIIYNSGKEDLIHLIEGRNNYLIYSNEKQLENYDFTMAENTITSSHLKKPILIRSDSAYFNDILYFKRPFLSFKDKTICICKNEKQIPDFKFDIIFSEKTFRHPEKLHPVNMLTKGTYWHKENPYNIFCLKEEGAFILNF